MATAAPAARAAEPLPESVEVVRRDEPLFNDPAKTAPRRGTAMHGARLPVFGVRAGPGCRGVYYLVGPLAWVCAEGVVPSRAKPVAPISTASVGGLPFRYFFVKPEGSFGYRELSTAEGGVPDAQFQPGFGLAVVRTEMRPDTGDPFGLTTHGYWVPMRDLGAPVVAPQALGVELDGQDFVWIVTNEPQIHLAPAGARRRDLSLARFAKTPVYERVVQGKAT